MEIPENDHHPNESHGSNTTTHTNIRNIHNNNHKHVKTSYIPETSHHITPLFNSVDHDMDNRTYYVEAPSVVVVSVCVHVRVSECVKMC